jgi:GSCFA family
MIRRECRKLADLLAEQPITFEPRPLIDKHSKVLALGSCFALRVKEWLLANGYAVLNEGDLGPYEIRGRREFDPRIYYNTHCIRYEFERVTGQFVQAEDDIWEPFQNTLRVYQDPYRRMLAGETRELLWERIRQVDEHMRRHILAADCVIITLGLTEVFFQQHNGRAICAAPGYGGGGGIGCEFRATEYPENFANIERVIEILREVNSKAQVILTVSPVPLAATWSGVDHAIANTESKSTLRAVAGAIVRRFDNVHYFHSYELVMHADRNTVFKEDGRHVLPEYVAGIMRDFESAFVKPESALRRTNATSGKSVSGPSQRKGPHFIDLSQSGRTMTQTAPLSL